MQWNATYILKPWAAAPFSLLFGSAFAPLSFSLFFYASGVLNGSENMILTDAASLEVSGCQSTPCCWTLTFIPSVSHRTSWQRKADFCSFDYNSWIIHTPCTFILQGPGVGWLDSGEYSFCLTVAGIPGNSIINLWCWTHSRNYFEMKCWIYFLGYLVSACPVCFYLGFLHFKNIILTDNPMHQCTCLYMQRAIAFLSHASNMVLWTVASIGWWLGP